MQLFEYCVHTLPLSQCVHMGAPFSACLNTNTIFAAALGKPTTEGRDHAFIPVVQIPLLKCPKATCPQPVSMLRKSTKNLVSYSLTGDHPTKQDVKYFKE